VAQDDHGAVLRRETGERAGEFLGIGISGAIARGLGARERSVSDLASKGTRAGPVDRPVDDDAMEPRPEGTAPIETVECSHCGEEAFLCDVLGGRCVVDDQVGGPVGAWPVGPEQRFQIRDRSGLGASYPGALVAACGRHRAPTIRLGGRTGSIPGDTAPAAPEVPRTIGEVDALLIVDFQNDFCSGGALPVAEGDRIAEPINALLDSFDLVIATRDWHPADHGSFEGGEVDPERWRGADPPSIWPIHCVQGTQGAELHPALERAKVDVVIDKGQDPNSQGYSGFQDTRLADLLRERGVDRLYVAGLATDYCVKNTVLDARRLGFDVTVLEDAIRGVDVDAGDSQRALEEMRAAGAKVASSRAVRKAKTPA
jgi:nicotinamidase/pyrazinamidase